TQVNQIPLKFSSNIKPGHGQLIDVEFNANHAYLNNNQHQALTRASLFIAYQKLKLFRHLSIKTTLQKEFSNLFELPLTTGLVLNYDFKKQLQFYVTMHNAYRMPTLNELYYFPGGNISLKPEKSRNIEGGLLSNVTHFRYNLHSNLSGYARKVKDWITWYGNAILTPHNIQEVRNYGIEYSLDFRYQPFKIRDTNTHDLEIIVADRTSHAKANATSFNAGILYSYNISTTTSSAIPNDYSIGKQIPYVPRYQFKLNLGFNYKAFDIQLIHTYTGYRFVTTDESQFLKPYQTTNLLSSINLHTKGQLIKLTGQVNNLLNNQYESIVGRTMPGRYFTLGLTWQYQHESL
ncbi:MAG: TonB-dependent receptor, partial [Chitinophagaceae bacterium]|nr:TonB-dependent receptor [Chitinophagaceae bacterium]